MLFLCLCTFIGSAYVNSEIGACCITGDGDLFVRFLPCYQAVESLNQGMNIEKAAEDALLRISYYYPQFQAGLVLLDAITGNYTASSIGWTFSYSVRVSTYGSNDTTKVIRVNPIQQQTILNYRQSKRAKLQKHSSP